ncbi:MAG: replicative DNA helicase [Deltaproteobacteria bacterium]|jgi:replicative DNA helicase|nr:replicative DNA helicase [Deltaproteobacteria bacterium]
MNETGLEALAFPEPPETAGEPIGGPQLSHPDMEVERAILGAIMANPHEGIPLSLEANLKEGDFLEPIHGHIYSLMLDLYNANLPVDLLTLSEKVRQKKMTRLVGGASYISELHDQYGIPGHVGYYAKLIIDRAILRRLLEVSAEISETCRSNPPSVVEVLDQAEASIYRIRDTRTSNRLLHVNDQLDKVYERVLEVKNQPGGISGVPTGYSFLDKMTGGFQATDLIIIGGRPGMGKTSLALNFALNAAIPSMREDKKDLPAQPVAIFSLEMGSDQLLQRLLCQIGHHNLTDLRTGRISDEEIRRLTINSSLLRQANIFIDDTSAIRPVEMRAKARRLKTQLRAMDLDLGLIIVDYLQLMHPNGRHQNREQEIREISGSLKALAKELLVPVITLSQLKRSDELEPSLADLRESGSIEQDADLVFFVVRPEMIKKDDPDLRGKAELRLKKHRNGPTGLVHLRFIKKSTSFEPAENFHGIDG